jgi:hypothetical protein
MSDPITATTGLLVAIWKILIGLIPAVLGAAISLRLNTASLTAGQRLLAFCSALAIGHYVGSAVATEYALTGAKDEAVRLLLALYGLNIARRRITGDQP